MGASKSDRSVNIWLHLQQVNGDGLSLSSSADLENLKAEILREIRTEMHKATQEILDGEWAVKEGEGGGGGG